MSEGMPYAQIAGWGMYAPSRVVTNEDLVSMGLDTSDEWITVRTGIRQRRLVSQGEVTSDLAVKAAERALQVAAARPRDVDLVIVATCSPDHIVPATAPLVQNRLGASRAGALDINAACGGFLYGLLMGAGLVESRRCQHVLVVGAETMSRYVDWKDRNTCILFGDGAGAVLLKAGEEPGVLSVSQGSDGSGADLLVIPAGGSRLPTSPETVGNGAHFLKMNGPQVFRFATQVMGRTVEKALAASGLTAADIDLLIPHQANLRIIEAAAARLRLPMEKVFVNVGRYGNTSAASIPMALCEAVEDGRLKPGDHLVLASFGAGLTWAAGVIRWTMPLPVHISLWRRLRLQRESRLARLGSSLRWRARGVRSLINGSGRRQ